MKVSLHLSPTHQPRKRPSKSNRPCSKGGLPEYATQPLQPMMQAVEQSGVIENFETCTCYEKNKTVAHTRKNQEITRHRSPGLSREQKTISWRGITLCLWGRIQLEMLNPHETEMFVKQRGFGGGMDKTESTDFFFFKIKSDYEVPGGGDPGIIIFQTEALRQPWAWQTRPNLDALLHNHYQGRSPRSSTVTKDQQSSTFCTLRYRARKTGRLSGSAHSSRILQCSRTSSSLSSAWTSARYRGGILCRCCSRRRSLTEAGSSCSATRGSHGSKAGKNSLPGPAAPPRPPAAAQPWQCAILSWVGPAGTAMARRVFIGRSGDLNSNWAGWSLGLGEENKEKSNKESGLVLVTKFEFNFFCL